MFLTYYDEVIVVNDFESLVAKIFVILQQVADSFCKHFSNNRLDWSNFGNRCEVGEVNVLKSWTQEMSFVFEDAAFNAVFHFLLRVQKHFIFRWKFFTSAHERQAESYLQVDHLVGTDEVWKAN